MIPALALVAALLAPAVQETHELKWTLKEGQAFECAWTLDTKISIPDNPGVLMDFKVEVRGNLKVAKVARGEARCELTLTRYAIKGKTGVEDSDILFEDGKIRRPDPGSATGRNLQEACNRPAVITLGPLGAYSVEGKHLVAGLFGGQSDFFGSQLPPKPVEVGESWGGKMESPQARQAGRPPMKVRYKLESRKGDEARIVLDERQDIKAAGKVMNFHAATESTFNVAAGHCTKSKATIHVNDVTDPKRAKPEKPDMVVITEFEMTEKK